MGLRKITNKSAQQEMVGFILIVVLVVVALMVFLVISVRQTGDEKQSVEVENMLNVLMDYTTDCAIVFEPDYDTIEDLVKSCYNNNRCTNLDKTSCDYLGETLQDLMEDLMKTESVVNAYQIDVLYRDEELEEELLKIEKGNCSGEVEGASILQDVDAGDLVTRLRICREI